MKTLIPAAILLATIVSCGQQNIKLSVNFDNANKTYQYLKEKSNEVDAAREILKLPGTQGMIKHDSQFNEKLTEDNYVEEISDPLSESDEFRFKGIRKNLELTGTTIEIFKDSLTQITDRIEKKLSPYIQKPDRTPIDLYFVLGGNSDGYSTDKNTFYLELQFFGDDVEGIVSLVTHEIYHIIQQRAFSAKNSLEALSNEERMMYMLIENLYHEGSASFVADPREIRNPKGYSQFLQDKYDRNMRKLGESFYLFESLLSSAKKNHDENKLYGIAFGAQWDSPLYFVGFEICRQLEKQYGQFYTKKYLTQSPTSLLVDYIELYKSNAKVSLQFSIATEELVYSLHRKLIKEK